MEKTIISKMSIKTLECNPREAAALKEGDKTAIKLCTIYGIADGLKAGEDAKGTVWTCLTGNFEAQNHQNGKVYTSGKLFLPGGIHELVEAAVKNAGENPSVSFALELSSVRANNPIGYSYQGKPLMKPSEHDPLSDMRQLIEAPAETEQPKQLAPPAKKK